MNRLFTPLVLALSLVLTAFGATASQLQANGGLSVSIDGLRSGDGKVRVALWRDAQSFPDDDGVYIRKSVLAKAEGVTVAFDDLPPGAYAIAVFHDENDNGDFDQGLFGIPLEGYGFGRDAPVFFGPPDFEEASVLVNGEPVSTTVKMRY